MVGPIETKTPKGGKAAKNAKASQAAAATATSTATDEAANEQATAGAGTQLPEGAAAPAGVPEVELDTGAGDAAAAGLSAVQAEWGDTAAPHTPASTNVIDLKPSDTGGVKVLVDDEPGDDNQIGAEPAYFSLTSNSDLGELVQLGTKFKTALHIVLVATPSTLADQKRSSFPPVDLPFAKKGDKLGIVQASIKAYTEHFQSAFERDLLIVGDAVQLETVAERVATTAAQSMGAAITANLLQYLGAETVNEISRIQHADDSTIDEEVALDFLQQSVGFNCTFHANTTRLSEDVTETTYTTVVRVQMPSLNDANDVYAEHDKIEKALTAAQEEYGVGELQLTWLVPDLALVQPNALALLGHLISTEYYEKTTAGEIVRAVMAGEESPLENLWKYFPISDEQDVVRFASGHTNTGMLDGTWVVTCNYATA